MDGPDQRLLIPWWAPALCVILQPTAAGERDFSGRRRL